MNTSVFEAIQIDQHPLKKWFKDRKIKQYQIAKFCSIRQDKLSQIFNGIVEATQEEEAKLKELKKLIESSKG